MKKTSKKELLEIAETREYKQFIPYSEKEKGLWIACVEGLILLKKNRKKDGKKNPHKFNMVDVLHIMHTAFDAGIMTTKPEKVACPLPHVAPVSTN